MKPSAILINTARGGIVDQEALVEALQAHRIRGAGLDSYDPEPPAAGDPLFQLDNVVLTPIPAALWWKMWSLASSTSTTASQNLSGGNLLTPNM